MSIEPYLVKDTIGPFFLILPRTKVQLDVFILKTLIQILDTFNIIRLSRNLLQIIASKTPDATLTRQARPNMLILPIPLLLSNVLVVICILTPILKKQIKELAEISGLLPHASSNKHWTLSPSFL